MAPAERFRGAIPLLIDLPGQANRTQLVALEAWDDWFTVRLLEHLPPADPPPVTQAEGGGWFGAFLDERPTAPTSWEAVTDVGTRHIGAFAGGFGGGQRRWLALQFSPGLPDDARGLALVAGEIQSRVPLDGWPAEQRSLSVEIGKSPLGGAEARGETVDKVVRAYEGGEEELLRVVPLNAALGDVLGGPAWLLSIDAWATWFDIHYRQHPYVDMHPKLHGLWEASDDRGNRYAGFGNAATGRDNGWFGVLSFAPALEPSASVLSLVLERGLLRVEIPIAPDLDVLP